MKAIKKQAQKIKDLINKQAGDEGLWFIPEYVTEDYLQLNLRLLTAKVEKFVDSILEVEEDGEPNAYDDNGNPIKLGYK